MKKTRTGISIRKKRSSNLTLWVIAGPGLLYLLINNYIPMFGVFIAFKKINYAKGLFGSDWVGLKNFQFLVKTSSFWTMVRNTVLYNVVFIVLGTATAVFLAILVSELTKYFISKIIQAGLLLPTLLSMVIVSYIVYAFLSPETGLIGKKIIEATGDTSFNFYSDAKYWPFILTYVQLWRNSGYTSIIYIACITGIDKSLYESAKIDGAGKMKQIFYITIPQLIPMISIMMLMQVGRIFSSDFGLFYQVPMNSGALFSTTQTIDTYVYRALMTNNDLGMSSAAGLMQSVLGFILVMLTNWIVRKRNPDGALF